MKRIISALLLLLMCAGACASLSSCSPKEAHMGFQIISTDINEFILEAPDYWTVTSQNGYVCAKTDGYDGDESNLSVTSFQMMEGITTPEEYFDNAIVKSFGEANDMQIISRDVDTKMGEEKAKKYVYTLDMYGQQYKYMMVVCAYGSRIYVFTYTSTEEFYETHELEMQYVLEYFTFKA